MHAALYLPGMNAGVSRAIQMKKKKDQAAYGSPGGAARMGSLSTAERRKLASDAALARWAKSKASQPEKTAQETVTSTGVPETPHCPACAQGQDIDRGEGTHVLATVEHPIPTPAKPIQTRRHKALTPTRQPLPRVFGDALAAAEKAYGESIEELSYHENMTALLRARIPTLVQTIRALKNTQAPAALDLSLAPAAALGPVSLVDGMPDMPSPAPHPRVSRAQGGAVAVDLANENEDEDQFLRNSVVAAGEWH